MFIFEINKIYYVIYLYGIIILVFGKCLIVENEFIFWI